MLYIYIYIYIYVCEYHIYMSACIYVVIFLLLLLLLLILRLLLLIPFSYLPSLLFFFPSKMRMPAQSDEFKDIFQSHMVPQINAHSHANLDVNTLANA